jgi:hypothetical protein
MCPDVKRARGIEDKPHQRWCVDKPAGQAHLLCLEREYVDKLAFYMGMKLVPQCGTETRVLFLINMYEEAGSFTAYMYGQTHPDFLLAMDADIVKKVLHSTKIPAGLSFRTFTKVSRAFWQEHPEDVLRVVIVGAGCGLEAESMSRAVPQGCRLDFRQVDILGWVPGNPKVTVMDPTKQYLEPDMELAWLVVASISVSRSRVCEVVGILNKIMQALMAGGTGCISDDDAASSWAATAIEYLEVLEDNGAIEGFEFIEYPEQRAWQILFTKGTNHLAASVLEQAEQDFVADVEAQRVHKKVQIEAPILGEPAISLNVYAEAGDKVNMRHPVVYRLQLVKAIDGGYYLAYAGSGGKVVVRPPESVLERIKRYGLDGNSEWEITIEWQTKYLRQLLKPGHGRQESCVLCTSLPRPM